MQNVENLAVGKISENNIVKGRKSIKMLKSQDVCQVHTSRNVSSSKATKCLDEFIDCVRSLDGLSGNVARPNRAGGLDAGREGRGDELDNNTVDSTSGYTY